MKIQGKKIEGSNVVLCIIPRDNAEDIIFKCAAVLNMDDFNKLCPSPKIPTKMIKGGKIVEDIEAPAYKAQMNDYATKRISFMILKSLQATEGLEFETVSMSDHTTWENYQKELKDSGFSDVEVMRIVNAVMTANCLNENKIEEARTAFLASQLPELET